MDLPSTADTVMAPRPARWRRVVRRTLYVKLGLIVAILVLAGAAYTRLALGPVSLQGVSARVESALEARLGPGWDIDLGQTSIELQANRPALRADGIVIRNPGGVTVVRAPYAAVTLDPMSLLTGNLAPREIELRDLQLKARIAADGTLLVVPQGEGGVVPAQPSGSSPPPVNVPAPGPDASFIGHAVISLLDLVMSPANIVGTLDRAVVTGTRLTLIGEDDRERVAFSRVDSRFERTPEGGRRMALSFEGPRGTWRLTGQAHEDGALRRADVEAMDVPFEDIMLLGGFSGAAAGSNIKLSGTLGAEVSAGALSRLGGAFRGSNGLVTIPGQRPLRIEGLSGRMDWSEPDRRLTLADLNTRVGEGELHLGGTVEQSATGSWRLALDGRDATVPAATERDQAFGLSDIALEATFTEAGIALNKLALKGEGVDVSVSASTAGPSVASGMTATVQASDTSVRRLLSLWPDGVNPELRGYLSENLLGGTLKRMELKTELDPADLQAAFSGKPISDQALKLAFEVSGGRLNVIEGLPNLRNLDFTGEATGTSTSLAAKSGRIDMPDGRRLNFTDASFRQVDEHKPGSMAQIAFRLSGGADALVSFLRSPIFREVGAIELDPAKVKGRADLQVALPLDVHDIPRLGNLPVTVSGTLADINVERIVGRESLEAGRFAVGYQNGGLALKGDGKIGGSPATFDLRQPRNAPGEAVVNLALDEAARARRSLPVAPQVAGTVPVKITSPFGPGAKGPARFDVDLSRTAIDGLLPGWTKAAGRPARMTFNLADGDGLELRDLALEAAPVQLRGVASFSQDGNLERADLATFKLSPGDDMRAQVERSPGGYRVALRGNVGDARPVLKWVSGSGGGPGGGAVGRGRDPGDLDVDAAINIVTGHNDEALTGVTAKIGVHGRDLRALQLRGQFRSAPIEAQLSRDGGHPQLVLRSGDAGATLRFLDLYKRMIGGEMVVGTTVGDVQAGTVQISSFSLRNEPALKRIATQNIDLAQDERNAGPVKRLEGDQVDFAKLNASFRRSASRVEYKDVVIWGAQVGFTLAGYVDYARDRTEILGTFVPAYGLNNAFSQVPVVGLLLGGGNTNEGLFAIDFKVSGAASAPTLTVNPLTAVAPGILRKMLGWMMQEDDTTATVVPSVPRVSNGRKTRSSKALPPLPAAPPSGAPETRSIPEESVGPGR